MQVIDFWQYVVRTSGNTVAFVLSRLGVALSWLGLASLIFIMVLVRVRVRVYVRAQCEDVVCWSLFSWGAADLVMRNWRKREKDAEK